MQLFIFLVEELMHFTKRPVVYSLLDQIALL